MTMLSSVFMLIATCTVANLAVVIQDLNFAVLVPEAHTDGNCTAAALEIAVEDVNKVENFIHNDAENVTYKLKPKYLAVDADPGNGIESLYSLYHGTNTIMTATVGPPYKDQVEYCSEYSVANALLSVSYTESNEPMHQMLIFFIQSPPAIFSSFVAAQELMYHYNWTRIALVYDYSDKRYRKNGDTIRKLLKEDPKKKITIVADKGIWSEPAEYKVKHEIGTLQNEGARIIVALVSVPGARKLFCEAYHRQMTAPKIIWILFEILPKGWASDAHNSLYDPKQKKFLREIDCTEEQLLKTTQGYIAITKHGLRKDGVQTSNNVSVSQFRQRLKDKVKPGVKCEENVAYAYDAIWLLAYAKRFASDQERIGKNYISNFNYYKFSHTWQYRHSFPRIKFEGLTGPVSLKQQFSRSIYSRIGRISYWANKNSQAVYVGQHDTASSNLTMEKNAEAILFQDGIVPKDHASYVIIFSNFEKPLLITMWIVSSLGIILANILLLIIILCSRLNRNGSMTWASISVNSTMLIGSIFCYASVIIYGLDTRFVSTNNIHDSCWGFAVTLSIGFSMTFGALFAKAWQLYKLYMTPEVKVSNNQLTIKNVPEWSLLLIILFFLIIDASILGCWASFSPFKEETRNITAIENLSAETILLEQIIGCTCEYETEFTIGIYCYKGVVLIFGIFLAWQTRNAKIKIQNESKQIAMAIYNVVAVSLIGVICVSVLANTTRHQAKYAIVAVCICICTTTTLLLVFLPKMRKILCSETLDINPQPSAANSVTESSEGKYSIDYMRRSMEKKQMSMKSATSTGTLATQISTDQQQNQQQQQQLQTQSSYQNNTEFLNSFPLEDHNQSVKTITPSYLGNSSFLTPPDYDSSEEEKRKVDDMGRLSSGIYIGDNQEKNDGEKHTESSSAEQQSDDQVKETISDYENVKEQSQESTSTGN